MILLVDKKEIKMYILSILFVAILGYIIGKVVEVLNKKVLKPLFYKLIKEI